MAIYTVAIPVHEPVTSELEGCDLAKMNRFDSR